MNLNKFSRVFALVLLKQFEKYMFFVIYFGNVITDIHIFIILALKIIQLTSGLKLFEVIDGWLLANNNLFGFQQFKTHRAETS